jgi:putative nucleotidyltransferase with HDIG domain
MNPFHPDDDRPLSAGRTLADVTAPAPHPFWLTVVATLGGLVIPAIAAIAAAVLLGPPQVPHASKAASLAAGALTIAEAIFAGLGAAALIEAAWRRVGLPGSGPANFLPLRWIRHRIAHRNVQNIIDRLRQAPATPSRESLKSLLDLSRELARRDIYTRAHSGRVSRLTVEVGQKIGLSPEECEMARLAGLLHDIGKLEIPTSILNKPGPLDPDEAELVRTHPTVGAALVAPYIGTDVVNAVRHHHERVDGAGYPDGVDGDALPLIARLVPVVDTYDALISDRAYRPGRSREEAFMELRSVAGTQLDPDLVEALIEVEKAKVPFGGALLGLAPMSGLVRRAEHLLHGSAAPAAAAITAIAVAGAGWLGVMSNTAGSHLVGSPSQSIIQTSPSVTPDQTASTESPPSDVAAGETPAASPVPSPSAGATGKSVAPLYFPVGTGKAAGKTVGTQGVLVTPPTATKNPSGQTTPTVITVGPSPIPNPTPTPVKTPPPPPSPSAPVVNSVSPSSGPSGIQVTIKGSNFNGTKQVKFGNNAASSFTINSAPSPGVAADAAGTLITVTVPPGTGTVPVTVTGPGGTSGSGVLFTYVGPSITTVSPLFGPPAGGTSVTLNGSNFNGATNVLFGTQPAQRFAVDTTGHVITAVSPPFFGVQEFDISVTTPAGTSKPAPNDQQFDYGPGITNNSSSSLSPDTGPWNGGTSVIIQGINFGSSASVTFNGVAGQVTSISNTQIVVTTPPRTGSMVGDQIVQVVVTTAGGQSDGGPTFTYTPPPAPTVTKVSPASGPVSQTATVVITGTNFIPTSGTQVTVNFGGKQVVGQVLSPTSVTCTAPPGTSPGPVDVQVTALGGQSATNPPGDAYTYTP